MAKKHEKIDQTTEALQNVENTLSQAEVFIEKNRNPILIGFGVVIGLVLVYYGYIKYFQEPLEAEAQQEIFMAQKFFEEDSLKLALNGRGENLGFIDVADEYSSTKAGNLANYYAGICYLNLGQFENAIEYLDKFKSDDQILSVIAKGAIGDAFLELNQAEDALDYYKKAADQNKNSFATPIYLMRAAQTAELLNDYKSALSFYNRLKKDYPKSDEARDIEKNIAYAEAKLAK